MSVIASRRRREESRERKIKIEEQDTTRDRNLQDEAALHLKAGNYDNVQWKVNAVLRFLVKVIAQACNTG